MEEFPPYLESEIPYQPIYEKWPGWEEDISDIRDFEKLPENAKKYIARIEELIGIPAKIISNGPGREQAIFR